MALWQDISPRNQIRAANNFADGLDTSQSPFFVKDSALVDGYGFDFQEYPALSVRRGREAFGASGGAITRLLTNFGNQHLVRAVGTKLQYNSSGNTWTDIPGAWANQDWDSTNFDIGGSALVLTNGQDTPQYWNGSTLAPISQMPKGRYAAADNRRVYTAGKPGEEDIIYYCAFQDALDWSTAENSGAVQYYTSRGGPITALHSFEGQIWVFKKDSFALVFHTGDARVTHRLVEASSSIGCASYKTVKEVGPYLFWLGVENVYMGAGGGARDIGSPIRKYLERINKAAIGNACAFSDAERYYLCIPAGSNTEPDTCLVYHIGYNKWLPYSINLGGLRFGVTLNETMYAGNASGMTFKMNTGSTDEGAPIPWRVESRPFDDGVMESEKELHQMYIQGYFPKGTNLKVQVSPEDQGLQWLGINYDPMADAAVTQNKRLIVPLDVVPLCNYYRYRIEGNGPATIQEIQRYSRIQPPQL